MKICVFCHDAYMSGANKSLYDWIKEDENNRFVIILPHKNPDQPFSNLRNVEVYNGHYFCVCKDLNKKPAIYILKKGIKNIYMFLLMPFIYLRLCRFLKRKKIDAVISNSFSIYYGAVMAKWLNIPHIWHIREFMDLDHQIEHYNLKLINYLANYSSAIFISDVIREYYEKKYVFKNSIVIYNRIEIVRKFEKSKILFKNNVIRIIIVGTLQENKGQMEAIEAVNSLLKAGYDVYLDIYGEGPFKNALNSYIKKLKISHHVNLKGYCKKLDDVRNKYDIALVCSFNEALGRTTIESMGSGCITIGANSGCTAEIIKNGYNGFLYNLHDYQDLANKIAYVFNHAAKMNAIRINARKFVVDNFSKPIHYKITNFIDKVIL